MALVKLGTKADYENFIKNNPKAAIDFFADWCGPCRVIGPAFEEFSKKFTGIKFGKIDVDANDETAAACGVSAMPTFQFYLNGAKFDELVGASKEKLEEKLEKLNGQ